MRAERSRSWLAAMLRVLRLLARTPSGGGGCGRRSAGAFSLRRACGRGLADTPKADAPSHAPSSTVQGSESAAGLRVRRARPSDAPRLLRFVRENAAAAWPHAPQPPQPPPAPGDAVALVLADHVARALAQGHSMLAEQAEGRRGWTALRGLALGARVCAWDARLLERAARCVRCPRARRSLHFAAHCLRAPRLHDKYRVHAILQVLMVVPPAETGAAGAGGGAELVRLLVRSVVQRAADAGIPLVRVDVSDRDIAKILEELQFKKEWHMEYEVVADALEEQQLAAAGAAESGPRPGPRPGPVGPVGLGPVAHFVSVYTTLTSPLPLPADQP